VVPLREVVPLEKMALEVSLLQEQVLEWVQFLQREPQA
jgi:hypothetical protein